MYANETCTEIVITRFEKLTKMEIINHIIQIVPYGKLKLLQERKMKKSCLK